MIEEKSFVEYGNGVYYFKRTGENFANALAGFLATHTNLEVTAMTGDVVRRLGGRTEDLNSKAFHNSNYGVAIGYFVTFREKK